ncbi:hypothetical protein K9L67_03690 [Candidatus Woesearchaeota archaeon]|nr:hypothetical protein [Candidatus Woesearchaeota archaeon]MCF7901304.1 hypothetical protein [Candidatus Woesearchaeota archaeon]MCF8013790.1 hypothetical protein [Candidatus Woesearchaeota archaeon]
MKNNKKKGEVQLYFVIAGLVAVLLFVFAGINFASTVLKTYGKSEESINKLYDELQPTKEFTEVGQGKYISLKLDKETAIIGMNPGKDFHYIPEAGYKGAMAYYMKRPENCKKDKTCMCLCSGYDVEDAFDMKECVGKSCKITCDKIECKSLEDINFPERTPMNTVFSYKEPAEFQEHFWLDSIIILRSDKINPTGGFDNKLVNEARITLIPDALKPDFITKISDSFKDKLIVSGYSDYITPSLIDVFFKIESIDSNNNRIISMCLKDDCI